MADGGHVAFSRKAAVNVAVPPLHVPQGGPQIGARRLNDGFPPCDAGGLFADEGCNYVVAGSKENAAAGSNGLMAPAQINAARDFSGFVKAGNFGVEGARQKNGLIGLEGACLQIR